MSKQKQRIADFIESIETEEVGLSTVLLGGATKPSDGTMTARNMADCSNASASACNSSHNAGACKNMSGCCTNSTNTSSCNNQWVPKVNNCSVAPIYPAG